MSPMASISSASDEDGRFSVGTVLAGRYRVLGLIGRGGMGEVYKANDLILNQTVALKFLVAARINESALARFRNEVRIARQVSHPNVCRVYDLGMVDGLHFLSMEYLDGEDLASLLRRIGRLPQDKAMEFTRKICAGLSAAHERGVLHRDLKPANVMIDGRGHVRITDFGLAGLEAEIPLSDVRSGTPAYMSPEQKVGKEVTTRSDIYSLGMVLYEMFTGQHRKNTESTPSDIVKDLDPAIERVILRCLEEDPKRRPSSALNVAMGLPGSDPIAAALAAGETPSPEMVAASSEKEGFSKPAAIACFASIVLMAGLAIALIFKANFFGYAPLPIPPEVLADRAQGMLHQFGYTETPKSSAWGFDCCETSNLHFLDKYPIAARRSVLASHQPALMRFWYRQHRDEFWADSLSTDLFLTDVIGYDAPANTEPGMIRIYLDARARLVELEARPVAPGRRPAAPLAPDWNMLFAMAGLDSTRFMPAAPSQIPPMASDAQVAWTGSFGDGRPEQVRVEAAAWDGRIVYFRVLGDWLPQNQNTSSFLAPSVWIQDLVEAILVLVLAGSAFTAWNNLRRGRGDRRGASILAGFVFFAKLTAWAFSAAHVASSWELHLIVKTLSWAAFLAGLTWLLYLSIEPYVRRHSPGSLISWSRLFAGRTRDALVASHVLAGCVLGMAGWVLVFGASVLVMQFEGPDPQSLPGAFSSFILNGSGAFVAWAMANTINGTLTGLGFVLLLVLVRIVVRRTWIAAIVAAVLISIQFGGSSNPHAYLAFLIANTIIFACAGWLLTRAGLLAAMASFSLVYYWGVPPAQWHVGRGLYPRCSSLFPRRGLYA
jgi:hypothetical protein